MPAGFQVFTHNGNVLQIDQDSIVYSLRKAGKLTCSRNIFGTNDYVGLLDITAMNSPMAAVSSSVACTVEIVRPTGDFLPYGSSGRTYLKLTCNQANAQIQYYLFDQWNAPGGNTGIEVFDGRGNTVFHSDWYLLDVSGFLHVPANTPSRTEAYNAGSIGSNKALAITLNRVITLSGQGGAPQTYKEAVRINNGNALVSYVNAGDYGVAGGYSYLRNIPNKVMVIDTKLLPNSY